MASDAAIRRQLAASIRELRRIRHLTQVELGRRIGMRSGPMNAIEQGRHVPTGRVLIRLADALGVSIDRLLGRAGDVDGAAVGVGLVRESESAGSYCAGESLGVRPVAERVVLADDPIMEARTVRDVDRILGAFLALEDLCGAQKRAHIPLCVPLTRTEAGLDALSLQVRQMLGISHGVIFDYLELLENAGLRIVFARLPEAHQSLAFYDGENANAFIVIQAGMNVERQLFELIKRFGAIYLHTVRGQAAKPGPAGGGLDDRHAARKFAALFLMPALAVGTSVAQLGVKPDEWTYELVLRLKHRFGVSAQAFVYRIKELGLISEARAVAVDDQIKAHYRRTNFGEPDSTRRVLSPNGRLGDLILAARSKPAAQAEVRAIATSLRGLGVAWGERRAGAKRDGGTKH